jgi:hypothetical protein
MRPDQLGLRIGHEESRPPAQPGAIGREFVAADHLPFAPPVTASVDFIKAAGS